MIVVKQQQQQQQTKKKKREAPAAVTMMILSNEDPNKNDVEQPPPPPPGSGATLTTLTPRSKSGKGLQQQQQLKPPSLPSPPLSQAAASATTTTTTTTTLNPAMKMTRQRWKQQQRMGSFNGSTSTTASSANGFPPNGTASSSKSCCCLVTWFWKRWKLGIPTLLLACLVVAVNLMVVLQPTEELLLLGNNKITSDFYQSRSHVVEETKLHPIQQRQIAIAQQQQVQQQVSQSQPLRKKARVLIGIITADNRNDCAYRKRHRTLFESVWKDPRVCTLHALEQMDPAKQQTCQIVYTFVVGANPDPNAPTEITNSSIPLFYEPEIKSKFKDVNEPDVTRLNIRENMNDGKSPTFFYFASLVLEKFGLDYAMKLDADSILHLHDFLLFLDFHLPPPPWNVNIMAGALRDKAGWPPNTDPAQLNRLESFWGNEFEGVHLYLAGQCYMMSLDLCQFVAQEAALSHHRVAPGGYLEGHEDHDVSAMAFHSPTPIHMITIGKSQRFWEHPVKGQPRWERILKRETARMQKELFEGKQLRLY